MAYIDEVKTCWAKRMKSHDGIFGIEIETEAEHPNKYPTGFIIGGYDEDEGPFIRLGVDSKFWEVVSDNSLRNYGIEYVLKEPVSFEKAMEALDEFDSMTKNVEFLYEPPACSVHVHMNIQSLEISQIGNLVTLWTLFENILIEFCGESRRSNLFALPMRCAEKSHENFMSFFNSFEEGQLKVSIDEYTMKYGALNLAPVLSRGSLEFRSMRGTTDISVLQKWIMVLNDLREAAKRYDKPTDILDIYRDLGPDYLFKRVFTTSYWFLKHDIEDFDEKFFDFVERNLYYACCIAYSVDDWKRVNTVLSEKKRLSKGKTSVKKTWTDMDAMSPDELNDFIAQHVAPTGVEIP